MTGELDEWVDVWFDDKPSAYAIALVDELLNEERDKASFLGES